MDGEDGSLELEELPRAAAPTGTALERIKQVSVALSDAARRKRVSSRGGHGGLGARRGAKLVRWLAIGSFLVIVAIPSLGAAGYYYLVAADQYVAEAEFTVSVGIPPTSDTIGGLTGMPTMMIIQDTQVVANFIHSRAAVDKLDEAVQVRDLYADPRADRLARFSRKKPIERFVKYWNRMSDAPIELPGGIVHLKVRAFSPEAARKIARATVDICEQLVNDMNARMNQDAVDNAARELEQASHRVAAALAALERARNESGIVETQRSAEAINQLVKESRQSLLNLQGQYDAHLKDLSPLAPEMLQLNSRIEVTRKQLAEIEAKLTQNDETPSALIGDATIAQAMTKFGELDLERKVAEQLYATAAQSLEVARLNAENKLMYLKTFVTPKLPEEALYPRRALMSFIVLASSLAIWGLGIALGATFRNHMA